jgi:CheY-like chemotaxis protein/HPt (histidine-containing phosphotransfer) domain-containing protein
VELMGGKLELESTPGKGSKFWFELPFELTEEFDGPAVFGTANEHVLIVDDNATNRLILEELLSDWKVRHVSAPGGKEALSKLAELHAAGDPITTLLLDMQMPKMSGLDVARELRRDERFSNLHLLMLTSLGPDAAVSEGIPQWVEQVLVKPIKQDDLAAALPGLRLERRKVRASKQKASDGVRPDRDARGYRILLVEDHPLNQEVMKDMLGALGYGFDLAENGQEALEALRKMPYSLVLMDCQMPVLDGYEATRRWRSEEAGLGRDRTPIVAVTAHALPEERERVLRAGMDDFLTKPVKVEGLREMMHTWLRGAKRFSLSPPATSSTAPGAGEPAPCAVSESDDRPLLDDRTPRSPRMCELFVEHTVDDLDFIQEALAIEDGESLRARAHRLKGSSFTFGAEQLGAKAAEVERLVKSGSLDVEAQVSELLAIFERTCGALDQEGGSGAEGRR